MKIRAGAGRLARDRRGQGLVEFALVFPVLALFLFGILDLGRAVYAYNTISNAARQGARVAAVNQVTAADTNTTCAEDMPVEDPSNPHWSIRACAAAAAVSLGVQPTAVTVSYAPPADDPTLICSPNIDIGCIASVTVASTWVPLTPVIGNLVGSIPMTFTSQIPVERVFP